MPLCMQQNKPSHSGASTAAIEEFSHQLLQVSH